MDKVKNILMTAGPAAGFAMAALMVTNALTAKSHWAVRTVVGFVGATGGVVLGNKLAKK